MILGNTYHLALRPGEDVVRDLGGLHALHGLGRGRSSPTAAAFSSSAWRRTRKITEQAAVFRSHIDGSLLELSPERAVAIQEALGSDVAMVLDHVIALPADRRRDPRRHAIAPSAGPRAARRAATRAIRRSSPSCKAASIPSCASGAPSNWRSSIFPATPSAA